MSKPKVFYGDDRGEAYIRESHLLVNENTGRILMDEYMDPSHLKLGNEGYKKLQEKKVETVGKGLLRHIQTQYPEYHAYPRDYKIKFLASPEGELTRFYYAIKTRHNGGLSWLFPKTLVRVSADNGIMPDSIIGIDDNLKKDSELENLAINLGEEYYFSFKYKSFDFY